MLGDFESLTAQLIENYEGVLQKFNFEPEQAKQTNKDKGSDWKPLHDKFKELDAGLLMRRKGSRHKVTPGAHRRLLCIHKTRRIYAAKNLKKLKEIISKALTAITDPKIRAQLPAMAGQYAAEMTRLKNKEATARTVTGRSRLQWQSSPLKRSARRQQRSSKRTRWKHDGAVLTRRGRSAWLITSDARRDG
jgi:hypothetical protein